MSIELKITGNHATDLVAQINMLSEIFGGTVVQTFAGLDVSHKPDVVAEPIEIYADKPSKEVESAELPEKLNRKEQDTAVEEMIAAGVKDARYDLLTKSRQNAVNDGLAETEVAAQEEPVEEVVEEAASSDVDYMFEDAPKDNKSPTREDVSMLMAKIAKDKDGAWLNEKALKVRAVLVENIPLGQDPKVRNIPEDKLGVVYAALKKMED